MTPAAKQSAASSEAAKGALVLEQLGQPIEVGTISGHFSTRTFCAISNNEIALTQILSASMIA